MTKQLLTIEFRYKSIPKSDLCSEHTNKTITIGVYDTIGEAVAEGNKAVGKLRKTYKIYNEFKVNGLFGKPDRLVCSYGGKNGEVYAKITELKFDDLDATIQEVVDSNAKYKKYMTEQR